MAYFYAKWRPIWRTFKNSLFNLKDSFRLNFFKFSPSDSTEGQSEGNLKDNLKEKVLQIVLHLNLGEPLKQRKPWNSCCLHFRCDNLLQRKCEQHEFQWNNTDKRANNTVVLFARCNSWTRVVQSTRQTTRKQHEKQHGIGRVVCVLIKQHEP